MDLGTVKNKLDRVNLPMELVDEALDILLHNTLAFTYANESLDGVELYLVFKHTGGLLHFKTINGKIISDKLDHSYLDSRELVCLPVWNVRKSYRVTLDENHNPLIKEVDWKDIHKVLFTTVEPTTIKYVLGIGSDSTPATITVDCDMYKGLSYIEFRDCVVSSYLRNLSRQGNIDLVNTVPSCHVVSYTKEA